MKLRRFGLITVFVSWATGANAQEVVPLYTDYLSDNVYLVHPAAAGIGDCGKIRLTGRNQWSGVSDAPELQTLSFQTHVGEKAGVGGILFNNKNGYHSQQGIVGTYAYHIELGRIDDVNLLSFGLSVMLVQNAVDQTSFVIDDPVITPIIQSRNYVNADFGMAYHNKGFFSYVTVKNLLLSARNLYDDDYESLNLRRYLLTAGYYFNGDKIQFEPSTMLQIVERTREKFIDINAKIYKKFDKAQLWAGVSFRQGFDGNAIEELQYLSPLVGVNYKQFMVGYTYTKQSGDYLIDDGAYHQITLGVNLFCKPQRGAGCPNINASF